jgi:hypothetical protein
MKRLITPIGNASAGALLLALHPAARGSLCRFWNIEEK